MAWNYTDKKLVDEAVNKLKSASIEKEDYRKALNSIVIAFVRFKRLTPRQFDVLYRFVYGRKNK